MECVHEFIFAPHRVCQKCGVIDDDVRFEEEFPFLRIRSLTNGPMNNKSNMLLNQALPPKYLQDGECQTIKLGNRTILVGTNWDQKRIVIGIGRIRYICCNLNAEYLIPLAKEKFQLWLKHPWVINKQKPQTRQYRAIAYLAIWYAMRMHHYPMTFTRFVAMVDEFQDVCNFHKKVPLLIKGIEIEFPVQDLSQITDHLCEVYRYDAKLQARLRKLTPHQTEFNKILTQKAVAIAKNMPKWGNPTNLAACIMVYTAMRLEKYLIKHNKAKPFSKSDVMGYTHFIQAFNIERTYVNRSIERLRPQLQKLYSMKVEA